MLNYVWAGMMIIGIVFGILEGRVTEVTNGALDASKEAIALCITMMGVMSFWVGLMEIAKQSGLIETASRLISPFVRFLFPNLPKDHRANEPITTNIIANVLGLGWAATPAGLQAMEALAELEEERRDGKYPYPARECGCASNEMCSFLIINISSLQLIPMNIIAYRSQYGSVNPTAIVGPGILATTISTLAAVIYCKWKDRKRKGMAS